MTKIFPLTCDLAGFSFLLLSVGMVLAFSCRNLHNITSYREFIIVVS